ncbi:MAG: zf-HC2 domain-containing protein [Gammaproteobacteria bacterium]
MQRRNTTEPLDHEQALSLLPWYVNGTLDAEERRLVARHLQDCKKCWQEHSDILKQSAYCARSAVPELSAQDAFNRLLHRIENESRNKYIATGKMTECYRFLQNIPSLFGHSKPSAAAWTIVLLVVPATLWLLPYLPETPATSYRTLSSTRGSADAAADAIHVIFAATADLARRQRILAAVHGKIIAGPNARGVYLIQIPAPQGSEANMAQSLALLRGETGVLFAEPASPPDASFSIPDPPR